MQFISLVISVNSKSNLSLWCQKRFLNDGSFVWEFPGGKIEKFESPNEAARREVLEEIECKLNKADLQLLGIRHEGSFLFYIYLTMNSFPLNLGEYFSFDDVIKNEFPTFSVNKLFLQSYRKDIEVYLKS